MCITIHPKRNYAWVHGTHNYMHTNFIPSCYYYYGDRQERRKYYGHREKSRTNPQHSVTIIIDGMDQHKTNLPRLAKIPKSVQGLLPLRTHVTGVLVHTRAPHGKLAHVYIDMLQFPHDCNVTIHVLLKSLIALDHLPPVLNIQLDNTAKENKNKFFLGFCALSIERKIFTKVSL